METQNVTILYVEIRMNFKSACKIIAKLELTTIKDLWKHNYFILGHII